jgi:hypothetical protein
MGASRLIAISFPASAQFIGSSRLKRRWTPALLTSMFVSG